MTKCDKCDKESTTHVTEVYQGTGEVKEFSLCDEHAQDQSLNNVGPFTIDTTFAGSPRTDPVELAAQFVADLERGGYTIRLDGETVSVTRTDRPQLPVRMGSEALRQIVGQWLARKRISRKADEIRAVVEALLRKG